jgi:hypothetical protein
MENATPITMQRLARAREKASAQEQWRTMEKTMDNNGKNNTKNNGNSRKSGRVPTFGGEAARQAMVA